MTYIRLDDRFPTHRKALAVGPIGRDLYVASLCYCSLHLTDGIIPQSALSSLSAAPPDYVGRGGTGWSAVLKKEAKCLVEAGLWEVMPGIGYRIHDYHDWNKTVSEINQLKTTKAEAGRRGGRRSGEARRKHGASPGEAESKQSGSLLPNPSTAASIPPFPLEAGASSNNGQRPEPSKHDPEARRLCTTEPPFRNEHPYHVHQNPGPRAQGCRIPRVQTSAESS